MARQVVLLRMLKSVLPVMLGALAKFSAAEPLFVTNAVMGVVLVFTPTVGKLSAPGDTAIFDIPPVPERLRACGVPATPPVLLVTVKVPPRVPLTVGVKVRLTTQLLLTPRLPGLEIGQVLVARIWKSPLIAIEEIVKRSPPVLLTVSC